MSKVKQMEIAPKAITKKELERVTDLQTELQSYLANIGVLEVQKAKAIYQVNMLEQGMDEAKKDIETKYGPININLVDGTFEEIVPEAVVE